MTSNGRTPVMVCWAFVHLFGCVEAANPPTPDPSGQEPERVVAPNAAGGDQSAEAVLQWADRASVVAVIEIASARASEDERGHISTDAVLRVVEVYRDDLGLELVPGAQVWVEVAGGAMGDRSELSSAAPLLAEGDVVLALLTLDEQGDLTFDGNNSVLPMRDDAVQVCVNPDPGALRRCIDAGAGLVISEALPHFSRADDLLDVPLGALRGALL